MRLKSKFYSAIILLLFTKIAISVPLNIGSFNVNSGRTSPTTIAKQMAEYEGIEIWGISESASTWPSTVVKILETNINSSNNQFKVIKGSTARDKNLLQIYYKTKNLHLISHMELDEINPEHRVRAPLVAKFLHKPTNQEFLFMLNHLYRTNNTARLVQSKQLNDWIKQQTLPVIAVGDYNFDMSPFNTSKRGPGFDAFIKDNVMKWIEPSELLPSQCSSYKSILDFIFISDKVRYFDATSTIEFQDTGYCSNKTNSDHRPVLGMIDIY